MYKSVKLCLKLVWNVDPCRFLYELIYNSLKQFFNVFYGVWFLRTLLVFVENNKELNHILSLLIFMLLVQLLFYYTNSHFKEVYLPRFQIRLQQSIHETIAKRALRLPYDKYNNPEFLDLYKRVLEETAPAVTKIVNSLGTLAGILVAIIMIAVYIIPVDPIALLMSLLPLVYTYFVSSKKEKSQFELTRATTLPNRKKEYAERIFYLPQYAKELKLTGVYRAIQELYDEGASENITQYKKHGRKIAVLRTVEACISDVLIIMLPILYVAARVLLGAKLQIGDFVGIAQSIDYFAWDIEWFFNTIVDIKAATFHIKEYTNYLDDCDCIVANDGQIQGISTLGVGNYTLSFRDVAYAYPGSDNGVYALRDINLDIRKGEKIAVVGENGAGKSTLASLLMHLISCTEGSITLDGQNINSYAPNELRNFFGVVLQDFHLYPLSVRENIDPKGDLKDEEIWSALRKMELDCIIKDLDTPLTREFSENGLELSGGQQQRLALARVVAKNYPFVILDEPTSALDPLIEQHIYCLLNRTLSDRTLFFISHRLATTQFVDRIIVVKNGTIVEIGSHSELIALGGYYYSLYTLQETMYKEKT